MKKLLTLILILCLSASPALSEEVSALLPASGSADLTSLAELSDEEVPALVEALRERPQVTQVDLTGVKLSTDAMQALLAALPDTDFLWQVTIGKTQVDSTVTQLDLDSLPKKMGYERTRDALNCLPHLTRVTMFDYRFSIEEMETLIADHPEVKFDWTILLDKYRIRTDCTAFSTMKGRQEPRYTQDDLEVLKYCTDLLALDLGHNNVTDLSFLSNWPHLKRLIVIDSKDGLSDISPLAQLHDLEYVELFMQDITDLTPLADKPYLLDLNLCFNNVTDLTPLYSDTALERLFISRNPSLSQEQLDALQAQLPNCKINSTVDHSTGADWRVNKRYDVMHNSFIYRTYYPFE